MLARFLVPSLLGIACFLTPIRYEGDFTILVGVLTDMTNAALGDARIPLLLAILTLSAVVTPLVSWGRISLVRNGHPWRQLVDVQVPWVVLRIFGAICGWMIYLQVGPQWIWHESTGQIALNDLAGGIMTLFIFAAFLLPFLTDYGFMEFVGEACRKVFRRSFKLPGRSAIDAMASWLTAAAVGVIITSQQYQRGFYTARESAVIATNFSIASLPFCLFTTEFIGLGHVFFQVYLTVFVLGVVATIITPRLPPLSRIPDEYFPGVQVQPVDKFADDHRPIMTRAIESACERAAQGPGPRLFIREATANVLDIWFGLLPAVVLAATLGMALVEYTSVMHWLSWPFVWALELLHIPEAHAAAPTMIVGFMDMFLPAAVGASIDSELTRFVVCCVSLTQLIYMSEVGVLMLKTPLPLNFLNLVQIFLLRTAILLPLSAAVGHLLY
jgi:nucleoside recognition membrane protein YjiH